MIEEQEDVEVTQQPPEEVEEPKEETSEKEEFVKNEEFVPSNKYNQLIRKQRELEVEKRELEKRLAEAANNRTVEKSEEKDEDDDDDFLFGDEEKKESPKPDTEKIIEERLKPVMEKLKLQEENDRKIQRKAFFEAHPEYLESEKWNVLLDEMENFNPNSKDEYYTQLEKAHRIISGDYVVNRVVEDKKREMAVDAATGADGASRGIVKEEFSPEEKQQMKEWGITEDGMRAAKAKLASGSMRIL